MIRFYYCPGGVIGSHVRLKIESSNGWRFKSSPGHIKNMEEKYVDLFHIVKNELIGLINYVQGNFSVEHVGGSSIKGAITKGDLDICIITEKTNFQDITNSLKSKTTVHHLELWTNNFAIFHTNKDNIEIDIVVVVKDSPYDTFVAFRNILLNNPELLQEYNTLKRTILNSDKQTQRDIKIPFIKKVLKNNGFGNYE